jgi:hypothetical protein
MVSTNCFHKEPFLIEMDKILFQFLLKQVLFWIDMNKMKFAGLLSVYMFLNIKFNQNAISIFADETWTGKMRHLCNPYIS